MRFLHARAPPSKPNGGALPHYGEGLGPFDCAAFPRVPAHGIEAAIGAASQTKGITMSNTPKPRPAFRIYSVKQNPGRKSTWREIGAAWPHKDGRGFQLEFSARPLHGAEIVLRDIPGNASGH
jgi:hypothetical protein